MNEADKKRLEEMQAEARTVPLSEKDRKRAEEVLETCIEGLAAYAHEAWSGWMKYQEKKGGQAFWDNLPIALSERWIRQANTEYGDLAEKEKKSDRIEARRMMAIMLRPIAAALAQARREGEQLEAEAAEVERLMVLGVRYSDERIAAESEAARQRERAERAENDKTICETTNRNLVKSCIAWRERVDALEKAAVLLALPYEGLLADSESRRWIAPALWTVIEEGVAAFRALLSPALSAEPSTEAKEETDE